MSKMVMIADPETGLLTPRAARASAMERFKDAFREFIHPDVTGRVPPLVGHMRRISRGQLVELPDGSEAHFFSYRQATPEEDARYHANLPEHGLDAGGVLAYRALVADTRRRLRRKAWVRLINRLAFWRHG